MSDIKRLSVGRWFIFSLSVIALVAAYFAYPWLRTRFGRMQQLSEWLHNPSAHAEWGVRAGERCGAAPFILPTSGFIGFIWGDAFTLGHQHQGIDVFGGETAGKTPVLAAYSGYLTRLPGWKSTLIIRIPLDPLRTNRQIWTYYTHMASADGSSTISPDFPPGTSEVYVETGTFLGYQGDYSGDPQHPVGVHLHFSIVMDDGTGSFRNELAIGNTLDPTPYLGLPLNAKHYSARLVTCDSQDDVNQAWIELHHRKDQHNGWESSHG